MLSLGLSSEDYDEYMYRLATGYEFTVTCQLMTPEREVLSTISHLLLDGQVDWTAPDYNDGRPAVGRTARLVFVDPDQSLALDSSSPAEGSFFMDRLIRVIYSVRLPAQYAPAPPSAYGTGVYGTGVYGAGSSVPTVVREARWVDVPVFTGPIVKVDRDGDLVDVECHGMEHYALGHAWSSVTRSGNKVSYMQHLMGLAGEKAQYLDFPTSSANLIRPLTVGRDGNYWGSVWRINQSMNRVLFYDGRGVCVSRAKPGSVAITFREAKDGLVAEPTQVSYSTDELVNAVQVKGAEGSKGKPTPISRVTPPEDHPLHPARLGRNGKPYVRAEFITNADLKTSAACRELGLSILEDHLSQQVDVSLHVLPVPHLEPWDLIRVESSKVGLQMRALAATLPLVQSSGSGTPMSIGHTRNVISPRRPVRRP